jgi:hypothetical protein
LIIGSEGTLGVITEITLRLQKIPQHSVVAVCNFPTVKDAADVAIATMMSGIQVSRVELLDEVQIRAINMANGKNLTEAPTLMFEFIGTGDAASYFLYFPSDISSYLRLYISCSSLLFVSNICRYYRNHIHSPVSSILFGYRILMLSVATRHRK